MEFPVTLLAEPRAVRLVASARLRDPVLHLLLDDPSLAGRPRAELEQLARDLAEIEGGTSARLTSEAMLAASFPDGRPHANFVNAAFAYWRPRESNRFNDAGFGAWYAALEEETSLAEVVFHITRELDRVRDWNAVIDWAEMWASFAGAFVDLRELTPRPVCLDPDPGTGYPAGNRLGHEARSEGLNGIVYPSLRRAGGTCLVALWPHAVQSVAQGAILRTVWAGAREPRVERPSPARLASDG
ncbi:RES domain-containing protein [Roseococcus sp. SYP-B2431]|uniref:RES family NAD+ phosphorylase n=1 Tax=Roseococcus sp. SYP-B2431 TaxID=2496640 RepID=UPI001039D016|nr:RES family NAD+ phosphorylase [Roseococcus sp. SYP-B2431]TCH97928.1 RES domain-containing protein [Roseococcus sp. SYP-B2431]